MIAQYTADMFRPAFNEPAMQALVGETEYLGSQYRPLVDLQHWTPSAALAHVFFGYVFRSADLYVPYTGKWLALGGAPAVVIGGLRWRVNAALSRLEGYANPDSMMPYGGPHALAGFLAERGVETCRVISSHGEYVVAAESGCVLVNLFECRCGECLADPGLRVLRFDFFEWLTSHDGENLRDEFDILDLGYWFSDASGVHYQVADPDHRRAVKEAACTHRNTPDSATVCPDCGETVVVDDDIPFGDRVDDVRPADRDW